MDTRSRYEGDSPFDEPLYSRLFVVYDRNLTESDLQELFSSYGEIENLKIIRGPNGNPKGVCFIKFSKASEAAKALEGLHNTYPPNSTRQLKIKVAVSRFDEESKGDDDEDKYKRLFLHVPRVMTENELEKTFAKYGKLRAVTIQRDHHSGESKGFAYVSYSKFSEAALASEECERQYRPIFAKPKSQRRPETSFESNIGTLANNRFTPKASLISMMGQCQNPQGYTKVYFICCPQLKSWEIEKLFDIIPGLINVYYFVDNKNNCGKGTASYSNPTSAAYAVEKLHEFEYPPGMPIFVKPDKSSVGADINNVNVSGAVCKLRDAIGRPNKSGAPDLAELAEAIAEASKLIKKATGDYSGNQALDSNDINKCSVELPPPKPFASIDSPAAKRCFLVCKPSPPPLSVLKDIFCRFGDLVDVYTLPNKSIGYARYASVEAADNAIATLHGAEVCGIRMKVLEAEAEAPPRKRRYDE